MKAVELMHVRGIIDDEFEKFKEEHQIVMNSGDDIKFNDLRKKISKALSVPKLGILEQI